MKSSLVFVTAALLLATALAGCSDSASSAPASTPGSQAAASSEAAASSQATVSSAPVIEQNVPTSQSVTPTGQVVRPLPLTVDIANLGDCSLGASVEPDGIFLDNTGRAQMTVTLYDYDRYDVVDIAALEPGDVIEYRGADLLVNSVERDGAGLVSINGVEELGRFDLLTDDNTSYYECGMNGVNTWLALGTVTLPVNEEFFFVDDTGADTEADVWYLGDFLTPGTQLPNGITPYNTTVRIENGQVMDLFRIFVP